MGDLQARDRNQTFQSVSKKQHKYFPHSMKNIHLYHSAVMHFSFFKKKKISSMYFVSPSSFKEKKGHFFPL